MTHAEIQEYISNEYFNEENIKEVAYGIWERQGKPNGEEYDEYYRDIKLKDIHWFAAIGPITIMAELDADIFEMINIRE